MSRGPSHDGRPTGPAAAGDSPAYRASYPPATTRPAATDAPAPVVQIADIPAPSDDALLAMLITWLPAQRWFAGDAAGAAAMTIDERRPIHGTADWQAEFVLLRSPEDRTAVRYQVIIGRRVTVPEHLAHAVIGAASDAAVYDGLHDAEITAILLEEWSHGRELGGLTPVDPDPAGVLAHAARAHTGQDADQHVAHGGAAAGPTEATEPPHGLVLTQEQSNSSVVYGNQLIVKFFRRLAPGINPDAEITRALRGSPHTPAYRGEWRTTLDGEATTVALATEFIGNSADAWSLATSSVRDLLAEEDLHADEVGGDFAAEAHRMGEAIAHLHRELAERLPLGTSSPLALDVDPARLQADATRLAAKVPDLEPLLPALDRTIAEATAALDAAASSAPTAWPPQRIHGDLHLGQVLRSVHGWLVIDFEGEPTRPVAERRRPGSPLQDIAGMLRSFGYAARQPLYESTVNPQRRYRSDEWMTRNRGAFLDGYASAYGADPRGERALLTLFELAKAIYEVDYEYRHRPTWVEIPIGAIRALTASDPPGRANQPTR